MLGILNRISTRQTPPTNPDRGGYRPVTNNQERYISVLETLESIDNEVALLVKQRDYKSLRKIVLKGDGERPKIVITAIAALAGIDKEASKLLGDLIHNQSLNPDLKKQAASLQTSLENVGNEDPYETIDRAGYDSKKIKRHFEGPRSIADIAPMILRRIG